MWKAAAVEAIDTDFTKYTPNAGIADLKDAIGTSYRAMYGVEYGPSETIVTAVGKQALYNVALALFGSGDEVITHSPGWPTIVEQIKLADAEPVIVRTAPEEGFRGQGPRGAERDTRRGLAASSSTRLGNPTGALVTEEDLTAIADEVASRGLWILVDLCYEQLIYDRVPHNLPKTLVDRMRDRTVVIGTVSKTYAMTGWRCGWVLGRRRSSRPATRSRVTRRPMSVRSPKRRRWPRSRALRTV